MTCTRTRRTRTRARTRRRTPAAFFLFPVTFRARRDLKFFFPRALHQPDLTRRRKAKFFFFPYKKYYPQHGIPFLTQTRSLTLKGFQLSIAASPLDVSLMYTRACETQCVASVYTRDSLIGGGRSVVRVPYTSLTCTRTVQVLPREPPYYKYSMILRTCAAPATVPGVPRSGHLITCDAGPVVL